MPTYSMPTGNSGVMEIRDDGHDTVELWLKANTTSLIPDLPWTYILNGVKQSWRTFEFARNGYWQKLAILHVPAAQTIAFILGETGNAELGGPTEFAQYISRTQVLGSVRIPVNGIHKSAIPYVKVAGVWRQAEPWAKSVGVWSQTT